MKKLLVLIVAACVGVLIWFLFLRKNSDQKNGINSTNIASESPLTNTLKKEAAALSLDVSGILAEKYPRWEGARATDLSDPRWKIMHEREKLDRAWQGKMPIDFYGKIVDLDGQPIEGAVAKFSWTDLSPAGSTQAIATSDGRGLFSLIDAKGKFLGVQVEKEGYYTSKLNRYGYEFASFSDENFYQPDPGNPVIFHLRKKGQAEALVYRQTLYGLKIDGTPQYIDITTGRKITGGEPRGDISLSLVRSPSSISNRYDWTLSLSGIGAAGLVESNEEFMFTAPETGYKKSIIISQKEGASNYERQTRRNYYVRLADGRTYARLDTDVRPKYNDEGAIDITLYLNPFGSRNLEFDPERTIEPKP